MEEMMTQACSEAVLLQSSISLWRMRRPFKCVLVPSCRQEKVKASDTILSNVPIVSKLLGVIPICKQCKHEELKTLHRICQNKKQYDIRNKQKPKEIRRWYPLTPRLLLLLPGGSQRPPCATNPGGPRREEIE